MTTNTTRIPAFEVSPERASELFGQTQGAMVLTGAGLGWVMAGLSALREIPPGLFLTALVVAALLFVGAGAVRRFAPGITETSWSQQTHRFFWLVFAAEAVAIVLIIAIALRLHNPEWIPPLAAAAVGLHFLPLARLFHRPLYTVSGAALCCVCLGTIVFMPQHAGMLHGQGWRFAAGLGSGAVLWLSALWMLLQSGTGLRKFSRVRRPQV